MTNPPRNALFAALVAALLLGSIAPGTALSSETHHEEVLSERLLETIQEAPEDERVHVIVATHGPSMEPARDAEAMGVEVEWVYSIIDAFSAWVTVADLPALAQRPWVDTVWDIALVEPVLETSTQVIQADKAWAEGHMGQGISVAVLDTGIDLLDPIVEGNLAVSACASFILGVQTPECQDTEGHGTHVAATVASSHPDYTGVAPDAEIAALRVLHGGVGNSADTIAAMEWVAENKDEVDPPIRVINLSLGPLVPGCGDGTSPEAQAANATVQAGVSVVVAAGNAGHESCTVDGAAAASDVITVGAVDDQGTPERDDVTMWPSSSAGPTTDNRSKPEIVAPGVSITSLFPAPFVLQTSSGTSMAAPHVAGAAALVHAEHADLDPLDVRELVMATAYQAPNAEEDLPSCGSPWGWGLLDVDAMFQAVEAGQWDAAADPCDGEDGSTEDPEDPPVVEEPVEQSKAYILGGPGLVVHHEPNLGTAEDACSATSHIGGALFCTEGGFASISATLTDRLGLPVPGILDLRVDGENVADVPFCGSLDDEPIEAGVDEAFVFVGQTAYTAAGGEVPCSGEGTQGTIDVVWDIEA